MDEEVALTTSEFKALSSKTRTDLLKMLDERNYTLSELAAKSNMAAPTVKQHTSVLVKTGLIELRDEGRKWKYYALTRKGRKIIESKEKHTNILIILSSAIVVGLVGIVLLSVIGLQSLPMMAESADRGTISEPLEQANDIQAEIMPGLGIGEEDLAEIIAGGEAIAKCAPVFEVEIVTEPNIGISASEQYSAYCFSNNSKEKCEQVDVYSKNTKTFGDKDGISDCEWQE